MVDTDPNPRTPPTAQGLFEELAAVRLREVQILDELRKLRNKMVDETKLFDAILPGKRKKRGRKASRKPKGAPALTAAVKALPRRKHAKRAKKVKAVDPFAPAPSPLDAVQEPKPKRKYVRKAKKAA